MKPVTYLVLGVLLLLGAAFCGLMTAVFVVTPSIGGDSTTPVAAVSGACTAIFAVPAVVVVYLYRQTKRRDETLETVGALLRSVREIPVAQVAARVGKTPEEAEVLISQAVSKNLVQGYIDPRERKFVATALTLLGPGQIPQIVIQAPPPTMAAPPPPAPSSPIGQPDVRYCRECGTRIERVAGQPYWKCPACGNVQSLGRGFRKSSSRWATAHDLEDPLDDFAVGLPTFPGEAHANVPICRVLEVHEISLAHPLEVLRDDVVVDGRGGPSRTCSPREYPPELGLDRFAAVVPIDPVPLVLLTDLAHPTPHEPGSSRTEEAAEHAKEDPPTYGQKLEDD